MRKISFFWFLYENLTDCVKIDCKVDQLISMGIHFLAQKSLLIEFLERSESFKSLFACELAAVASEFGFESLWHFKELFSADFFRKVAWCHEHLSSTLRVLIIIKHGNQGKNMSCGVSINSSTRQDFDYAFTFRCNYEHIFDISVYFLLKIA